MPAEDLYVFPGWLELVVEGNVNVLTDTLEIVLLRSQFSETDFSPFAPPVTMDDIDPAHVMSDPVELEGKSVSVGRLFADDAFWPSVPTSADTIRSGLVYWNTGIDPTDKILVSLHNRRSDSTLINESADGGPKLWRWSPDGVLSV